MLPLVGAAEAAASVPHWVIAAGLLGALAFGVASAFFPPLNAEVFALAAPLAFPQQWLAATVVMTLGLMAGKVSQFLMVRYGSDWWSNRRTEGETRSKREKELPVWRRRLAQWSRYLISLLDHRVAGGAVIFASGAVGFPPLALVTLAAGARPVPVWWFGLVGTLGCLARFVVTAALVAWALP